MPKPARTLALVALTFALTVHPVAAQPTVEEADALYTAEDWTGAVAAYQAIWEAAEDPSLLQVQIPVRTTVAHLRLGQREPAFEWLERAVELGLPPTYMDSLPALADLREDSRFAELRQIAERKSFPCSHEPRYRDFDFWIGSWDVYAGTTKAGANTITRQSKGCMLYESWTNAAGTDGHSINYVDPATDQWVQVWMGADGSLISGRGGLEDGAMRLVGERVLKTGERRPFRMTFTPADDGSVRQFIEESADGGETFTTWFDGKYLPAGSEPPAAD